MAAIPQSTRDSITVRLLDHAEACWPQLARVQVTYRGAFGYVTGVLRDGQRIHLCRLRYGGSAHSFGFAIYSAAHDRYPERGPAHRAPCPAPRKKPSTPRPPSTSPGRVASQANDLELAPDELTAPTTKWA